MFKIAQPRFADNQKVKLRNKINIWIKEGNKKPFLGTFTKGHQFEVLNSFPNMTYANQCEAFGEEAEIILTDYIYEVQDKEGRKLHLYEEDLKRVKEYIEAEEEPDDEESDEIRRVESQTSPKPAAVGSMRPRLIKS